MMRGGGGGGGAEGGTSKGHLYSHSESMGSNAETIIIIRPLQWCCPTMTMHTVEPLNADTFGTSE